MLWRKYRRFRECNNYDGDVLHREESSEPMSKPLCSHLLNSDQMKCSETQLSITADDMEVCDGPTNISNGMQKNTRSTSHSSTNGSIITMTLKNNHLIVETEERNDIEEDSRETTMKYSPGARDGVFVVEVQQGSRRSPGSGTAPITIDPEPSVSISDQCALVHNPPDRYSDDETLEECEEYYTETSSNRETPSSLHTQFRTGLTQSDCSLSSSSFQTYRYGNQQGYESGYYGYSICNGNYVSDEPTIRTKDETTNKPKIISEILKNRSDSKCETDSFLFSDVYLNENVTSGSNKDVENDPIQEEQKRLGNSVKAENRKDVEPKGCKMNEKLTRSQINPSGSKKFEELQRNNLPLSFDAAETDVRSVEYENKGFESTDLNKT